MSPYSSRLFLLIIALSGSLLPSGPLRGQTPWGSVSPPAVTVESGGILGVTTEGGRPETLNIVLQDPEVIPEDATRYRLWAADGVSIKSLKLVIEDASGLEHLLATIPGHAGTSVVRRVDRRASGWGLYESEALREQPADVSGRVLPEFRPVVEKAKRPRPWKLKGIRVELKDKAAQKNAPMAFSRPEAVRVDGLSARTNWLVHELSRWGWDCAPVIFADDLVDKPGRYRFLLEIREGYGGPVIWRQERTVKFRNRAWSDLFAERLELPDLPKGRFFLETRAFDEAGTLVSQRDVTITSVRGPAAELPELPGLRWTTETPNHVFAETTREADLRLIVPKSFLEAHGGRTRRGDGV
jgi:hypothetical protein